MTRYAFHVRISGVEQRFRKIWKCGVGKEAEFDLVNDGWWITTEGPSPISFCVGTEKPEFQIGDMLKVSFEKQIGPTNVPTNAGTEPALN